MRISEREHYEILDAVADEGESELLLGPLTQLPRGVPSEWAACLRDADPRSAVAALWRPFAERVPRIYRGLLHQLQGVGFLRTDEEPASLIYFFADGDECVPFRGRAPLREFDRSVSRVPIEFAEFFQIHNGWVQHYVGDGGPLPLGLCLPLATWDDTPWSLPPGELSLEDLVVVFRDRSDVALAYDVSVRPEAPLRAHGDGSVDVLLDMWAAIDAEVGTFLDGLAPDDPPQVYDDPSRPAVSAAAISRYEQLLPRLVQRANAAAQLGGGAAYDQAAMMLLQCAVLEREGTAVRDRLVDYYRRATRYWCMAVDLGSELQPSEMLVWFGVVQALGDVATAHFVASVPTTRWADDTVESLQARSLFSLYLGQDELATVFCEELSGRVFDGSINVDEQLSLVTHLLEALTQQRADMYRQRREQSIARLSATPANQRALVPWSVQLAAFDAVAASLGLWTPAKSN